MTREEAIEAIKAKMDYYDSDKRLRAALETLIPELNESEDEKIRKEIISALKFANDGGVYDKHIAYLERQKEQKEISLMNGDADLYFDEWNQQNQKWMVSSLRIRFHVSFSIRQTL